MNFKPKKGTPCVLYDNKICNECGECEMCDLDPNKKCNNCGKCLEAMMPETDEKGFFNFFAELDVDPEYHKQHNQKNDASKESQNMQAFWSAYGLQANFDDSECHNCGCDDDECNYDTHTHCDDECNSDHHHHSHHKDCDCNNHSHDNKIPKSTKNKK